MRTRTWLVALWLASPVALVAGAQEGEARDATPTLEQRIDAFDALFPPNNRLSGVLLVALQGEVVLHKAYGMADVELSVPNRLDTRINVASITKDFTKAVAIQMLVEGRMRLEDPIAKWLPDFPRGDQIAIDHLLRFRAGLPHRVTTADEESQPQSAESITQRAAAHVDAHGLLCEPGEASFYSSATYSVLARVMERIDGRPYGEILERRLFGPLGMSRSSSPPDAGHLLLDRASSYVPGNGTLLNAPLKDLSFLVGAGSVLTTAEDLYVFVQALHDPQKLNPGVRLSLGADPDLHLTGATNGFYAFADELVEPGITIVFLGNSWCGCADLLRGQLVAMIEGKEVHEPVFPTLAVEGSFSPESWTEYVGEYESRPGAKTQVSLRDGSLFVASSVALPMEKDRFFHQAWHAPIQFLRDESGALTAMRIEYPSGPQEQSRLRADAR